MFLPLHQVQSGSTRLSISTKWEKRRARKSAIRFSLSEAKDLLLTGTVKHQDLRLVQDDKFN